MDITKLDISEQHKKEPSELVPMAPCWWVRFNVDGYAPADAYIVPCATEKLANQIIIIYRENCGRTDPKSICIVYNGTKYYGLPGYSVEGYDWKFCYDVEKGTAHEKKIYTSLADLRFQMGRSEENDNRKDGIYGPT